jgi:hypothetical protein
MFKVIKRSGNRVNAYRLGDKSHVIDELISQGKIKKLTDTSYEIFSHEAVNGNGELATKGDYIKVDSDGFPYPNKAEFFSANHKWIREDEYEQIPTALYAWTIQEPMCEEIKFLINEKGLKINTDNPEHYFNAFLWGTKLSAAKDAVIVFYNIIRDKSGHLVDIEFNFVCRREFDKTYIVIDE